MTHEMNRKYISAIAAFLILGVLLSATPLAYAQTLAFGPKLEVVTIPQDDQILKKGIMILGLIGGWSDLLSQHRSSGSSRKGVQGERIFSSRRPKMTFPIDKSALSNVSM
jgi:hypothetical protein